MVFRRPQRPLYPSRRPPLLSPRTCVTVSLVAVIVLTVSPLFFIDLSAPREGISLVTNPELSTDTLAGKWSRSKPQQQQQQQQKQQDNQQGNQQQNQQEQQQQQQQPNHEIQTKKLQQQKKMLEQMQQKTNQENLVNGFDNGIDESGNGDGLLEGTGSMESQGDESITKLKKETDSKSKPISKLVSKKENNFNDGSHDDKSESELRDGELESEEKRTRREDIDLPVSDPDNNRKKNSDSVAGAAMKLNSKANVNAKANVEREKQSSKEEEDGNFDSAARDDSEGRTMRKRGESTRDIEISQKDEEEPVDEERGDDFARQNRDRTDSDIGNRLEADVEEDAEIENDGEQEEAEDEEVEKNLESLIQVLEEQEKDMQEIKKQLQLRLGIVEDRKQVDRDERRKRMEEEAAKKRKARFESKPATDEKEQQQAEKIELKEFEEKELADVIRGSKKEVRQVEGVKEAKKTEVKETKGKVGTDEEEKALKLEKLMKEKQRLLDEAAANEAKKSKESQETKPVLAPPAPDSKSGSDETSDRSKQPSQSEPNSIAERQRLRKQKLQDEQQREAKKQQKRPDPLLEPQTTTEDSQDINRYRPQAKPANSSTNEERREAVKGAFKHAWDGYVKYAWGMDELQPLDRNGKDWLGLGITIVDALDTLHIMGFKDELAMARDWVANKLVLDDKERSVSTFETTIRNLGGLLSVYAMAVDEVYLEKALDLGVRLLRAFSGNDVMPKASIELVSGNGRNPSWSGSNVILSEVGSIQMEFFYLAKALRNASLAQKPARVIDVLDQQPKDSGLYPVFVESTRGQLQSSKVTLGALGDSYYEYLLKLWLLTDKKVPKFQRMYHEAALGILDHMVAKTNGDSGLTYLAELTAPSSKYKTHKMDHLACFAGGMFALGAANRVHGPKDEDNEPFFELGKEITRTCHEFYARSPSGIGPEIAEMYPGGKNGQEFGAAASTYLLRPETVESYFVLWRLTHDPRYREWGWEAFQAIERHCRHDVGYAGIRNVNEDTRPAKDNTMQSFFLAETLKYLYLLFCPDDVIPLDRWVFNTEAHPLPVWRDSFEEWKPYLGSDLLE